jgi:hypothetical protein
MGFQRFVSSIKCSLDLASRPRQFILTNKVLNAVKGLMNDIGLSTKLYFKTLKDMRFNICIPQN